MGNKQNRKIRVLNGARAILQVVHQHQLRCVFVGGMPAFLNGGTAPIDLDLIVMPQPGLRNAQTIERILSEHKSTRFRFCLEGKKLKYVDLAGGIPAGKQNWCYIKIAVIQDPLPSKFDLANIVEIDRIPTLNTLIHFIDVVQDLLDRYDYLRLQGFNCQQGGGPWLGKSQIKKIRTAFEAVMDKSVVPPNWDRACEALSSSKRLIRILSGLSDPPSRVQLLTLPLSRIANKIENWMNAQLRLVNVNDDGGRAPVAQAVAEVPEQNRAVEEDVEEDCDEYDDWVEIQESNQCEERIDEALDFVWLNLE